MRAELRADPSVRRMLVEIEGVDVLLVRPDADIERLQTRLARLGVRLMELRPAATTTPPTTTTTMHAQNESAEHPIARGA